MKDETDITLTFEYKITDFPCVHQNETDKKLDVRWNMLILKKMYTDILKDFHTEIR
jgi:hypothetical protein